MTTIQIEVPAQLAGVADDLRSAIVELLDAATDDPDITVTLADGRILIEGQSQPPSVRTERSAGLVQIL